MASIKCRTCNGVIREIFDLGLLPPTGFIRKSFEDTNLLKFPLRLGVCNSCLLFQLADNLPIESFYTEEYGYRSSLNTSMVEHLSERANRLLSLVISNENPNINVLDIASNDGTFLNECSKISDLIELVGVDPLIPYMKDKYPEKSTKYALYFNSQLLSLIPTSTQFDLITSFSVLYDVENLTSFIENVAKLLRPNGFWYTEQSYFMRLLEEGTFDSICHEHLLYLNLNDIDKIASQFHLTLWEICENEVNGGSLGLLFRKTNIPRPVETLRTLETYKDREQPIRINALVQTYTKKVQTNIDKVSLAISHLISEGRDLYCLGASTKGNVILHMLGLTEKQVKAVGEVNSAKWGHRTIIGNIPIIPENEILSKSPEKTALLILPWHFKGFFRNKLMEYVKHGGKVLFPFPNVDVLSNQSLFIDTRVNPSTDSII